VFQYRSKTNGSVRRATLTASVGLHVGVVSGRLALIVASIVRLVVYCLLWLNGFTSFPGCSVQGANATPCLP